MPSFRAQSRNLPCTLLFLAPFAKVFPFSAITHTALYRCARKIEGFARDDVAEMAFSKHIRCTLREINPFSHTVISSAARNLPCTLLFLAPFAKVFPFSAITHTALYRCARKIEGFARDDDTGIALSQHILYTMRRISPYDAKEKSPGKSRSFFFVRKTYLPNCASMVPAATAVPITPATFGPMACISR